MTRRILLIRHGPSVHPRPGWIDIQGFRAWRTTYEAAGITDDPAPATAAELVAASRLVVASDTPRGLQSALRLAPDRAAVASPLLRELELLAPPLGRLRLPLLAWAVLVGLRAAWLRSRGRYPNAGEARRLGQATAWLIALAAEHGSVAAITHASVRGQLAKALVTADWRRATPETSLRHWSVWSFARGRGGGPGPADPDRLDPARRRAAGSSV